MLCRQLTARVLIRRLSVSAMVAPFRHLPLLTPRRACSSGPGGGGGSAGKPSSGSNASAVNVEDFTLNEEVVKADMEAAARWHELGERLEAARAAGDYAKVVEETTSGFRLLEELGPEASPIQCESMLHLETAQAHFNLGAWAAAQQSVDAAMAALTGYRARDEAQIAKVREFGAFITLKRGDAEEAERRFRELLQWIDVDARAASPMVAVAAVNMRRSVRMGLGMALEARATALAQDEASSAEAKPLFGAALDVLIESLDAHIEESDVTAVKETLQVALRCFVGLGDAEQAIATCKKYVSWCTRHEDAAGEQFGREEMVRLCARFGKENPL